MRIFTHSSLVASRITFLATLFFFLLPLGSEATIRYVAPTAAGTADGSSWTNASADLQAMINASAAGDEVWVKAGTYKPTATLDRSISFSMKNGVAIYGGFVGTETLLSQRNWTTNPTILSGDIGGAGNGDNSYSVIANSGLNNTAILDGFTITGGNASGTPPSYFRGGGMYNNNASPIIANCIFTNSSATEGGGMHNYNSLAVTLTNCTFSSNSASFGGGMQNINSSPTLTNCTFSNNSVSQSGGGMHNYNSLGVTLTNCTFADNLAFNGSGIRNFFSSPTLTNCILWNSSITGNSSTPIITYSIVQGGYAGTGNSSSDPLFVNAADPDGADNIWGTSDDGLMLQATSPAINAGINTGVTATTDLAGNARINGSTVDMGAYEYQPTASASISGPTAYCAGTPSTLSVSGTAPGRGLQLNGSSQYLITPALTSSFSASSMTIELWFKANAAGVIVSELGQTAINTGWTDSQLEVLSTGEVRAGVWAGYLATVSLGNVTLGTNTWNHAVVRYNAATNTLDGALNGVLSSPVSAARQTPGAQYWAFGAPCTGANHGSGAWFNGQIDEIRIWNTVRTNTEIAWNYRNTVSTNTAGLVAYYKLNETSGATATDATANGNHGTTANAPIWASFSTPLLGSVLWTGGATTSSMAPTTSGSYTVTVTDLNGNTATTSAVNITVQQATILANGTNTYCASSPTTFTSTLGGNGIQLNGTNQYLITPDLTAALPTSSLTIELWVKANAAGVIATNLGTNAINTGFHASMLEVLSNGEIRARMWNLWPSVLLGTVSFGSWNHVVIRYNGTTNTLDGLLNGLPSAASATGVRQIASPGNYLAFGPVESTNLGAGGYLNGQLDEIRIWSTARTNAEIANNYATSVAANSTGLVAYYKLDETSGTAAADATANGNHATAANAPSWNVPSSSPLGGTVLWSPGGATTRSIAPTTSGSYTVTVTTTAGCASTSAAVPVTVNGPISAALAGTTAICGSGSANLTVTITGGTAPFTVDYSGGTVGSYANGDNIPVSPAATTTYTLISVTDASGCVSPSNTGSAVVAREYPQVYVDSAVTSSGTGTTWGTAVKTLQEGINLACTSGGEVWVKKGTYKPTTGIDRSISFSMKNNVAIYGGFAGGETLLSQRNWTTNATILSGDIGGAGNSDNTYNVIVNSGLNSTAVLDGFTITGGKGGLFGGGMRNTSASPTIANCTFSGNSVGNYGGGMYNGASSSPIITNCIFSGNSATSAGGAGGGMYNNASSPVLTNCTFSGNSGAIGGGMYNEFSSSTTLTNCTFVGNLVGSGGQGAGMVNSSSSAVLTNCTFVGNAGGNTGGGMFNQYAPSIVLNNCTFVSNSSGTGGGMSNEGFSPTLTNCIFSGNSAGQGGGMYNYASSPALTNCTVSNNSATGTGSGMYNISSSLPTLSNCIIWNNTIVNSTSTPTVSYSIVQGGYAGTGNSSSDPLFVNAADPDGADNIWGTSDDGLRLTVCSPAINTGNNVAVTATTDLAGAARIQQTTVDMGAYESAFTTPTSAAAIAGTVTICSGSTANFAVSITGGTSPYTVVYSNGTSNTTVSGYASGANIPVSPTATTTYTLVSVTDANGCASPSNTGSAVVTVGVSAATLTGTQGLCNGSTANLVVNMTGGTSPYTVVYSDGTSNTTISGYASGANIPVSPTANTTYTLVSVSDANGCASSSNTGSAVVTIQYPRIYVDSAVTISGVGTSWATAVKTLQEGINLACATGGEVWVKKGTYLPTKDAFDNASPADPRDKLFFINKNITLYGGFAGTENAVSQRNIAANPTILSGDIGTLGTNSDNCYHVVLALTSTGMAMDGFNITGGNANGSGLYSLPGNSYPVSIGAGNGAGILVIEGSNTFTNNVIWGNTASGSGGGLTASESSITITNTIISGNSADIGGGISVEGGSSICTLINTTIVGNSANGYGGGLFSPGSSSLTNCIFANNTKGGSTSAVGADMEIMVQGPFSNGSITAVNSLTQSYATGTNLLVNQNPLFVNAADPDGADNIWGTSDDGLRLTACSPAINTGNNTPVTATTDIAGATRIQQTTVDMGAYESAFAPLTAAVLSGTQNLCSGSAANLIVAVTGGTAPYTVVYSNGVANTTVSGYTSGANIPVSPTANTTYTLVSVTDANGCVSPSNTGSATVTVIPARIYVDGGAIVSGVGTSWLTAVKTVQEGVNLVCDNGGELWVKAGTYYPTHDAFGSASPGNPRNKLFFINKNITLYGGFAGTETAVSQRNIAANPTILSGDIGTLGTNSDNCYHVVLVRAMTGMTMDGFNITGGNADGDHSIGYWLLWTGGLYLYVHPSMGAGVSSVVGSNTFRNNVIWGNDAILNGGGIRATSQGPITLMNSIISGNSAGNNGGGIAVNGGCTFINNTISGNSASNGGGFHANSSNSITNCIFADNVKGGSTSVAGADIEISNSFATANATNCLTQSYATGTNLVVNKSPLFVNSSDPDGADNLWRTSDDGLRLTACSPAINTGSNAAITATTDFAGATRIQQTTVDMGAYESAFTTPSLITSAAISGTATICGSSTNLSIAITGGVSPFTVVYSDGVSNTTVNSYATGTAIPVSLTATTTYTLVSVTDANGCVSPSNTGSAIVTVQQPRVYVDGGVSASGAGTSWLTAVKTLQEGINLACTSGSEVWVKAGTYKPTTTSDRTISFSMKNGVAIYGGFAGGETLLSQRNWATNATILSGDIGGAGNGDNTYSVIVNSGLNSTAVLDGFTITGGNANGFSSPNSWGGGMRNTSASPTIANCVFTNNSAIYGSGMFNNNSSSPTLTNCTYSGNTATNGNGGGMFNQLSSPTLTNCTFSGNSATSGGGGMHNQSSSPTLTNCTFSGNSGIAGSGLYNADSSPVLTNCIVWNSIYNIFSTPSITYSTVQGGYAGTGNSSSDPLFVNPADPDGADNLWGTADDGLQLQALSPAINAGTNTGVTATTDLLGNPRVIGANVDMGAYESIAPTVTASVAGPTAYCAGTPSTLSVSGTAPGRGLQLNGSSQYLITPALTSSFSASSMTIELWFKANAAGVIVSELGQTTINTGWTDSQLEVLSTGEVRAGVWAGYLATVSLGTVTFGTWNHAVVRYNAATNTLDGALNGVLSSPVSAARQTPGAQYWAFGAPCAAANHGSGAWFNGQIDEIRIWNTVRTNTEIAWNYRNTVATNTAGLVAYYKLNETSGATATDATANGNHGLTANTPTWASFSTPLLGSVLWTGGATTSSTAPTTSGSYTATVTDLNGNTATTSAVNITVQQATILANGPTTCITSPTTLTSPLGGNGLQLNGSNQYLITPDLAAAFPTSSMTIELWVKAAGAGVIATNLGTNAINTGFHASMLEVLSNGEIRARMWNLWPSVLLGTVSFGSWNHVVIRYDGTTNTLDGLLNGLPSAASATGVRQIASPGNYLAFGPVESTNLGAGGYLNGQLDEIRIWSTARTNAEIANNYATSIAANSTGLVAYYKLDETSGTTAGDATTNGYTATAVNAPTWNVPSSSPLGGTVLWSPGGATTRSIAASTSGSYTVTVTTAAGCASTSAPTVVSVGSPLVYVDSAVTSSGTGTSWGTAVKTLQEGINLACTSGGEVWVKKGTYKPTTGIDRTISFTMKNNVAIYGGFAGGETARTQRNWAANATILSGDIGGPGNSDNSYHVVFNNNNVLNSTAVLDGFTVTGGSANGAGTNAYGGGFYNYIASPTLTNVTVSGNRANSYGGGFYNYIASPTLTNVTVSGNSADNYGGGLVNAEASPTFINVTVSGNSANIGGGFYNYMASPTFTNVTVSGNSAIYEGGGIYNYNNSPTLTNVTVSWNSATNGGGIFNWRSSSTLTNCTVSNNSATGTGSGIYNFISSLPTLANCIIWNNTIVNTTTTPTITYSIVQGGYAGTGNSSSDPLFVNASDPDGADNIWGTSDDGLRLTACSPAINTGNNAAVTATTDIAGAARIQQTTVDMGAYESAFVTPTSAAAITGTATICSGSSANFTVSITGGTSPYTVVHSGGMVSGYASGANIPVSPTANTTYTLTSVTDANGCASPSNTGSAVVTVTPSPTLATLTGGATLCGSGNTPITVNITGGTSPYNIAYTNGSVNGYVSGTPVPVTPSATTAYTLTSVTDANGCSAQSLTGGANVYIFAQNQSPVSASPGNLRFADAECTTADGWTHYYNTIDNAILLSLKKNGQNIGTVGDGTFQVRVGMPNNPDVPQNLSSANYVGGTGSWYVMNRTWDVTPTNPPTDSIAVRFYYQTDEFNKVNTAAGSIMASETEMRFYKLSGIKPFPWSNQANLTAADVKIYLHGNVPSQKNWTRATTPDGKPYAEYFVGSFSGGGGGSGTASILSAADVQLSVITENKNALLSWISSNDGEAARYAIERGTAADALSEIGELPAVGVGEYAFTDEAVAATHAFYRIRREDKDGAVHYSNLVEVNLLDKNALSLMLFPNPTEGLLNISVAGALPEESELVLYDAIGKEVLRRVMQPNMQLNLAEFAAGIYSYRLSANGETLASGKVAKQ